jgi:hypothetical protein
VRNKTGTELQGGNRQEGSQTLKAERSGQARPVTSGPAVPQVLKGVKAQERSWLAAAGRLGFAG